MHITHKHNKVSFLDQHHPQHHHHSPAQDHYDWNPYGGSVQHQGHHGTYDRGHLFKRGLPVPNKQLGRPINTGRKRLWGPPFRGPIQGPGFGSNPGAGVPIGRPGDLPIQGPGFGSEVGQGRPIYGGEVGQGRPIYGGEVGQGRPIYGGRNPRRAFNRKLTRIFDKVSQRFPRGENAVDRLAGDKSRSTLVDLLGKNDLVHAVRDLEKKGPVTVLAPSNKAFENLAKQQPELFQKLTDPRNKEALKEVLLYHVSDQRTDFQSGGVFDSVLPNDGARFFGNPFQGRLINGDQRVNTGPASASENGSVVIPIDQVLIPPGFDPSKLL